jgi:hypothetical protein
VELCTQFATIFGNVTWDAKYFGKLRAYKSTADQIFNDLSRGDEGRSFWASNPKRVDGCNKALTLKNTRRIVDRTKPIANIFKSTSGTLPHFAVKRHLVIENLIKGNGSTGKLSRELTGEARRGRSTLAFTAAQLTNRFHPSLIIPKHPLFLEPDQP